MSTSPYASPHNAPGYGQGYGPFFQYEPLGWKTTVSIVGIAAMVVLMPLQSVFSYAAADALKNPVPENFGIILLNLVFALFQFAVHMGTCVFFLVWMNRAAKNIRAFGQQALTVSPGWCVGWWFVPIANNWMPFVAMREIWKASDPDSVGPNAQHPWMASRVPAMLWAWWGAYVLSGFLTMGIILAAFANADLTGRTPTARTPGPGTFISHVLMAIAGVLVIMILRQITQRQELAWQRFTSSTVGPSGEPAPYAPANPYVPADTSNPYAPPRS